MPNEPPPLPAVLRLAPHRSVVSIGSDGRVLGLDPASAVAVHDLSPPLTAMIDELDLPVPRGPLIARVVERGGDAATAESLLHELVEAGVVVDGTHAERRARYRAASIVVVEGRGPLTVGIVVGLLHAGVGRVHTVTDGMVRTDDLGTGLRHADSGSDRLAAVRAAVRRLVPGASTGPPHSRTAPDLVVLADTGPEPARLVELLIACVPHLPARVRDGVGVVGPLVLPGRSTCLACLELHRGARDPAWPSIAAGLVGRAGHADPACTSATAALATAQALVALDRSASGGPAPPVLDATLELDVCAGTVRRRRWHPHPECHCGAAVGRLPRQRGTGHGPATSGRQQNGDTIMG